MKVDVNFSRRQRQAIAALPTNKHGTAALVVLLAMGLLVALGSHADVRVWTGEETVILQGDLKGMEILPAGTAAAERSGGAAPAKQSPAEPVNNAAREPGMAPSAASPSWPLVTAPQAAALPDGFKPLPEASRFSSQQTINRPAVVPDANAVLPPPPAQQPAAGTGRVLRVGPNSQYKKPSDVQSIVRDGDLVEIEAGEYFDCVTWRASNIVLRGVNGRPQLKEQTCGGKAIWIIAPTSRNVVVENISFSGMRVSSGNGAGIRHEGNGLTLRSVHMHDGESGLLTGNGRFEDDILIENSLFERLGKSGQAHPIYVGDVRSFTLRNSSVRDCVDEANCVKTRAFYNNISCNIIDSANSPSSWEIDISMGGDTRIENNVIVQRGNGGNNNMVGYAKEYRTADPRRPQLLAMLNNIFINDLDRGTFLSFREPQGFSKRFSGNVYVGKGSLMEGADANGGRRFASRRAAGLPAVGQALPLPKACRG